MRRRLLTLAVLAVMAAAATFYATSAASFTTASSTTVRAATAPLSSDTLRVMAGDGQTATADTEVATDPCVVVKDAGGNPVSGVAITFAVASGGGAVAGAPVTTDDSGMATAGGWILGPAAGKNTLKVTAAGVGGSPVTFTATGVPGVPDTMAALAGDGQTATAGTAVAVAPSVIIRDDGGNPVSGVAVTFVATSGGGAVTGGPATTNASGVATAGGWTLGTIAGANTLRATAAGLTSPPVTFTATAAAAAATRYVVTSSTSSPVAGAGATISAQLVDQYGNAVKTPGISVTWSKTGTGGSITANSTTNASGIAAATLITSTVSGTRYTVTATSSGRTGTSAAITTIPGAPATIALNAGTSQSALAGAAVATRPSVLIKDSNGNPAPGVVVTFAVASGGGSATGGSATTSASGVATVGGWTLGTVAGANTLTATVAGLPGSPVTFTATGTAGAATKYVVTASTSVPAAGATATISAQLADQYGNAVKTSGISVAWSKTGSGGSLTSSSTTNSSGVATATLTAGTTAGTVYAVTASSTSPSSRTGTSAPITTVAAAASKYVVTSSSYAPAAGAAVTITAQLTDQYGNPVATSGITVSWTKTGGGGSLGSGPSITNASGAATVTLTTSTTHGRTYTVKASSSSPTRSGTSASIVTQ